ncbi:MAG TPA: IPT/TIG domain-containing protein [Bryobacteraceae bacterium]|nr:IPT/TIG domain-containing protein [Bryobacteraceae bacterium]
MKLILFALISLPVAAQPYYTQSIAAGTVLPATPAPAASIPSGSPVAVAADSSGRVYYSAANCIFRIEADGTATRIAGTGYYGFSGDGGPAVNAQLNAPQGIAVDAAGNVFVSDTGNNRIRRITPSGIIATIADGFKGPVGIAVDGSGNIYVADSINNAVRRISAAGVVSTVAPGVQLFYPNGVAVDGLGDVFIADSNNHVIRKVAADGTVSTIATGSYARLPGNPLEQSGDPCQYAIGYPTLCGPKSVAVDAAGNVYFADTFGSYVDTPAGPWMPVNSPASVAVDSTGNVYAVGADKYVMKISPSRNLTHIAGNGADFDNNATAFWSGFGVDPKRVTDSSGNVYVADSNHFQVQKIAAGTGAVTIVAGNGTFGFSGDGGLATAAQMYGPYAIALDGAGDLFIADNYRVREVTADGIIHTVAGNGGQAFYPNGDGGLAVDAQLFPDAIAVDRQGNLFIGVRGTNSVRYVGKDGIIHTIASGLNAPSGLTVDSSGNVYVLDFDSWVFKLAPVPTPSYISAVFDAASETATPVSPGKIIVIYGEGLGPATGVTATPANGFFGTELAGTTVSVNGVPAPVYYASSTQVNAIVPYATTGSTANVTVSYQGTVTPAFDVNVSPASPGIFTYNASGSGPAAVIPSGIPLRAGDWISLYVTGEGQTSPAGVDGKLAIAPPGPIARVTVTIGGLPATLNYAGGVPGVVAGLMQINAQIPNGVAPGGYVPVVVTIGDSSTVDEAVWIAVSN